MAITEKSRHEMYRRLEEILGPDEATTLMEHLPPVGWADVATKNDLRSLDKKFDALAMRLEARIDSLDARLSGRIDNLDARLSGQIDSLEQRLLAEMHSTLRTNGYLVIGAMAALVTLVSTVGALG